MAEWYIAFLRNLGPQKKVLGSNPLVCSLIWGCQQLVGQVCYLCCKNKNLTKDLDEKWKIVPVESFDFLMLCCFYYNILWWIESMHMNPGFKKLSKKYLKWMNNGWLKLAIQEKLKRKKILIFILLWGPQKSWTIWIRIKNGTTLSHSTLVSKMLKIFGNKTSR
jgi:hypothetical protein